MRGIDATASCWPTHRKDAADRRIACPLEVQVKLRALAGTTYFPRLHIGMQPGYTGLRRTIHGKLSLPNSSNKRIATQDHV